MLSIIGSSCYLIGSVGFLPTPYAFTPLVGILGFISGSFFIFCSEIWKIHRIWASTKGNDRASALFVEAGAMFGGLFFFIGTSLYWKGPLPGSTDCKVTCSNYNTILVLWIIGSIAFTIGGLALSFRHSI